MLSLLPGLLLAAVIHSPTHDSPAPLPRALAAGDLREGLVLATRGDVESRLNVLLDSYADAVEHLGESAVAEQLQAQAVDARCRSAFDPSGAIDDLEQAARRTLSDLEFRVVREAELPVGFPEPTPVGEIELKAYPVYRCVRTDAGSRAFWKLFQHIDSNEIAMTAPVEMSWTESGDRMRPTDMAFLYGDPETGAAGNAGAVEVVDEGQRTVLSIGCRGNDSERAVRAACERLQAWAADRPWLTVDGDPRVMSYNSPMVRRSRRYFEVQLPVVREVIDFGDARTVARWRAVDDRVMGGVSRSALEPAGEGYAAFQGRMSKDNNGGFASVRATVEDGAFDGVERIRLRFRGDGKTYKLRLRTSRAFDGVNHEVVFETFPDLWMELDFDLSDFRAVWRGRAVRDVPPLRGEDVVGAGFLISDDQVGPFRLEVARITAL